MGAMRFAAFFLITVAVPAQHLGSRAGGFGQAVNPVAMRGTPTYSTSPGVARGTTHGFNRTVVGSFEPHRSRGGFAYGSPYFPIWNYGQAATLSYDDELADEYSAEYPLGGSLIVPPATGYALASSPKPAVSVIREYNFGKDAGPAGEASTFRIVLKDGSTREATASWVSGGKLHYVDLDDHQSVLSPQLIDRRATERANTAKNLSIQLPPG
jgi:hypothetical protein